MNLFVYGTLLDPWIRRRVLGRNHRLVIQQAVLRGHRIMRIRAKPYPNAQRCPGSHAQGQMLCGLSPSLLARLDAYEGDEYTRIPVRVFTPSNRIVLAQMYRAIQTVQVTPERWTLVRWKRRGGYGRFLRR